jgi:hypothetical protein
LLTELRHASELRLMDLPFEFLVVEGALGIAKCLKLSML